MGKTFKAEKKAGKAGGAGNPAGKAAADFVSQLATGRPDVAELSHAASAMVSMPCADPAKIAAQIAGDGQAKPVFRAIASAWIGQLAAMRESGQYDGRNAQAVETGSALYSAGACRPLDLAAGKAQRAAAPVAAGFADAMAQGHRALQQGFTGVVFRFLAEDFAPWDLAETDAAMGRQGYPQGCWRALMPS